MPRTLRIGIMLHVFLPASIMYNWPSAVQWFDINRFLKQKVWRPQWKLDQQPSAPLPQFGRQYRRWLGFLITCVNGLVVELFVKWLPGFNKEFNINNLIWLAGCHFINFMLIICCAPVKEVHFTYRTGSIQLKDQLFPYWAFLSRFGVAGSHICLSFSGGSGITPSVSRLQGQGLINWFFTHLVPGYRGQNADVMKLTAGWDDTYMDLPKEVVRSSIDCQLRRGPWPCPVWQQTSLKFGKSLASGRFRKSWHGEAPRKQETRWLKYVN